MDEAGTSLGESMSTSKLLSAHPHTTSILARRDSTTNCLNHHLRTHTEVGGSFMDTSQSGEEVLGSTVVCFFHIHFIAYALLCPGKATDVRVKSSC